mmetsp:Transcript_6441/g.26461  ORF Transcript_6441/g.26461 Transcript_6441/m.26461 type:complete len:427 (+) Transcript_6441:1992-3272(+)
MAAPHRRLHLPACLCRPRRPPRRPLARQRPLPAARLPHGVHRRPARERPHPAGRLSRPHPALPPARRGARRTRCAAAPARRRDPGRHRRDPHRHRTRPGIGGALRLGGARPGQRPQAQPGHARRPDAPRHRGPEGRPGCRLPALARHPGPQRRPCDAARARRCHRGRPAAVQPGVRPGRGPAQRPLPQRPHAVSAGPGAAQARRRARARLPAARPAADPGAAGPAGKDVPAHGGCGPLAGCAAALRGAARADPSGRAGRPAAGTRRGAGTGHRQRARRPRAPRGLAVATRRRLRGLDRPADPPGRRPPASAARAGSAPQGRGRHAGAVGAALYAGLYRLPPIARRAGLPRCQRHAARHLRPCERLPPARRPPQAAVHDARRRAGKAHRPGPVRRAGRAARGCGGPTRQPLPRRGAGHGAGELPVHR